VLPSQTGPSAKEKEEADRKAARRLIQEGFKLEKENDLAGAIKKYEAAQRLLPNEGVLARIQLLRKRIANKKQAQGFIVDGYALEKRGDLTGAIEKYEMAQRLSPDERVQQRMATLRRQVEAAQRERREQEKQERQHRQTQQQAVTGTYVANIDNEQTHTRIELELVQKGNRVSGVKRVLIKELPRFNETTPVAGNIEGNRLNLAWKDDEGDSRVVMTIGAGARTLKFSDLEFRKQ
jgi:tetratricopeptide (TPR) repeat protein